VLVALDEPEALAEAGVEPVLQHVLADQRLARHGQEPLDHHVVDGDALHEEAEVVRLGLDPVRHVAQPVVEHVVEGAGQRPLDLAHPPAQVLRGQAHDLGAEPVEEGGVAGLVHQLGGKEQLDLPAWGGLQERREVGGHPLLADVERAE
jgi:hypothetical protein